MKCWLKPEDIPWALLFFPFLLLLLLHRLIILQPASLLCRLFPLHNCLSSQHVDKICLVDCLQHLKFFWCFSAINFYQNFLFTELLGEMICQTKGHGKWEKHEHEHLLLFSETATSLPQLALHVLLLLPHRIEQLHHPPEDNDQWRYWKQILDKLNTK